MDQLWGTSFSVLEVNFGFSMDDFWLPYDRAAATSFCLALP